MNYKSRKHVDLHVIDAIDEKFLAAGTSEALMLRYFLRKTKIHIVSHLAWDFDSLRRAVIEISIYRKDYSNPRKAVPYVHIGCHGKKTGLYLGDSPLMPWSVLSEVLLPLQRRTDFNIPISLSSCYGFYGAFLADNIDPNYEKRRPYYSLVGPKYEEKIGPLCDTFGVFYFHLLAKYRTLKKSAEMARHEHGIELLGTYGSLVASPVEAAFK